MKQVLPVSIVLAVCVSVMADEKKPDFDRAALEGKWTIVSGEKSGDKIEGKALEGVITFTKDTIVIKAEETHEMKFKLDAKVSPVAITMTGEAGPAKDLTAEGIIEVKGDEMKLTYAMPGEKRPTEFGSKKGDKSLSFVLKRMK